MQPEPVLDPILEEHPPRRPPLRLVRGGRTRLSWAVAGAACVLLVLGVYATREGAAITPDSVQYLSTAHHVARGEGAWTSITDLGVDALRIPFAPWPPLFPAALGGLVRLGAPLFDAARWLNVVLLALGVLPLAWVARQAGGSRAGVATVLLHAVLFYPVLLAAFVWSEPAYIALSLTSLALAGRGLRRDGAVPWEYVLAGLLASAAMLTRYIGFTLIGATALGIWLLDAHRPPRAFWPRLAAYLLPAALPASAWLARNRALTGYFFGEERPEAWFPWDRILGDTTATLGRDWIAPSLRLEGPLGTLPAAAGVLGALCLAAALALSARGLRFPRPTGRGGFVFLLWLYAAGFVIAMMLLSRTVGFDPINTRYLAPAYPVLLVLGVVAFRFAIRTDRRHGPGHRALNLTVSGVLLLAVPQIVCTGALVEQAGREKKTLTRPYWTSTQWDDPAWTTDPGLARLGELARADAPVLSNVWDFVGIRTGLATKPLPETSWDGYPQRLGDFPGALIAVHDGLRRYRATADDLRALEPGGRIVYLERAGAWTFFRVLDPESGP